MAGLEHFVYAGKESRTGSRLFITNTYLGNDGGSASAVLSN